MATAASERRKPLVEPVGQPECRSCPYEHVCKSQMRDDDPSLALTVGSLDTREWMTLRRLGITTTADLAVVDPGDDLFFERYYAETSHRGRDHARSRLGAAAQRAAMITAGTMLARIDETPCQVPAADIEVDLDIEWDTNGHVYLWGARVRTGQLDSTAAFHAFADWTVMDTVRERELAQRFVHWLRDMRDRAHLDGRGIRVFHWSAAEPSRLRRILGSDVADLLDGDTCVFTDLERVFKSEFLSVHGSSIKTVAPLFGFHWRANDAGGAVSQKRLDEAREDRPTCEDARRWLLSYNADDTEAMAVIRDGMRTWDG